MRVRQRPSRVSDLVTQGDMQPLPCLCENPAYPAHAQNMHEDEDERPLAQRDHTIVSDGDDQPLVQPAPRIEPVEERRDPATDDGDLAPLVPPRPPPAAPVRRRKGPQYGRTQLLHWNMRCQKTRASEQKIHQFSGQKKQKVKPSVHQRVAKTYPFCNSAKPRLERSRVSGFR